MAYDVDFRCQHANLQQYQHKVDPSTQEAHVVVWGCLAVHRRFCSSSSSQSVRLYPVFRPVMSSWELGKVDVDAPKKMFHVEDNHKTIEANVQ